MSEAEKDAEKREELVNAYEEALRSRIKLARVASREFTVLAKRFAAEDARIAKKLEDYASSAEDLSLYTGFQITEPFEVDSVTSFADHIEQLEDAEGRIEELREEAKEIFEDQEREEREEAEGDEEEEEEEEEEDE